MNITDWVGIYGAVIATILAIKELYLIFTNKPKLLVKPVHPDYQWFFILPNGEYQNEPTRKYGFLAYISVKNCGARDVSMESWFLLLETVNKKSVELKPISIPEPTIELGQSGHLKIYPVLGQKTPYHQGKVMIKSGGSVTGFSYFIAEFYGDDSWNPLIKNDRAIGKFIIQDVFSNKSESAISFTKITLEKAKKMVDNIDKIEIASSPYASQ